MESDALFCKAETTVPVTGSSKRTGIVQGEIVDDIVLDTGCSQTMVQKALVPESRKLVDEAVLVRCAHGDTVLYPMAEVDMEVDGVTMNIRAAVSESLPVSVLLGTDVRELGKLLQKSHKMIHSTEVHDVMVVTRAQARKDKEEEITSLSKEKSSGVRPTPLQDGEAELSERPQPADDTIAGSNFEDDDFTAAGREKVQLSRSQKRKQRHEYGLVRAKDQPGKQTSSREGLRVTASELQLLQENDETLEAMRKAAELEEPEESVKTSLFWKNGTLFRRWKPRGGNDESWIDQIVLPVECRKGVMHIAHTIPMGGHLGKKKTTSRLLQRFYWPTIHRDVADYCKSCDICQRFRRQPIQKAPMGSLPVVSVPFQRVAMDIVGPLPRSRAGNRFVLVMCDYATRWPEAVPLKNIDAERIAEELVHIFSRMGIPQEILTDQGSNFQSKLLGELYNLLHVEALRTSPYHPQTDGLVERFNQTLKQMLKKTASSEGKDWDKLIPYLLFAYREVPQESTGFSPFELLYGREVRGPLDVLKESWESKERSDQNVVAYISMMRDKLDAMASEVHSNLTSAHQQQKVWYDRRARERSFEPGDRVLILLPSSTTKLTAQWQGPYEVIKPVGKVNYLVWLHDRKKKKRVYHVNMLRKWNTPSASNYLVQLSEDDTEEEDIPTWQDEEGGEPTLGAQLENEQKKDIHGLLSEFSDVFRPGPGKTTLAEHSIETSASSAVRLPPYRLPHAFREKVQQEIKDMLDHDIIEHSSSDWASPIVPLQKADGTLRICVDYRRLNSVSKMDAYPMPRVDDMIDQIGVAKFISTLDLTKGYWQVPVRVEDRHKTAFATPFGLFQFKRMPFGLQGAPATFQRMVDRLLDGTGEFSDAYIDDIVVYSQSWEEHMDHLRLVLQRLRLAGLTVKTRKCQLGTNKCVYLGYVIGNGEVRPESSKLKAVQEFSVPHTKKGVRAFLGLTGYYRRFIPDYASIACPLTDLTRKSQPSNNVQWSLECDTAFKKLKQALCSNPVLRGPNFDLRFYLQTDASERGIGTVLSQVDSNGKDHPVAFFSKKLLPREQRYSTIEKECLAIKKGIQVFRTYLMGRPFTILTDHRSLEWLDRLKDTNSRLSRWSLFLQEYNYSIVYRPGSANANADGLSRQE